MSNDPNDILFGSSTPGAKFENFGDSITGTIVNLDSSQQRVYRKDGGLGDLKTWPDGRPMMQVIVTLQTTLRDPSVADDDGRRRVFIKGKRLTDGVRDAVRAAGARRLDEGGTLTVKFVGEEDTGAGSPAKVYAVGYTKPSGADAAAAVLGTVEPVAQPVQPVQPVVSQPEPVQPVQQTLDTSGMTPEAAALVQKLLAAQSAGVQA